MRSKSTHFRTLKYIYIKYKQQRIHYLFLCKYKEFFRLYGISCVYFVYCRIYVTVLIMEERTEFHKSSDHSVIVFCPLKIISFFTRDVHNLLSRGKRINLNEGILISTTTIIVTSFVYMLTK